MDEYPGNSNVSRLKGDSPEPEKVQKVIVTKVTRRKKPIGRRFIQTFFGDVGRDVVGYVIREVLAPAMKDMIVDAGTQAIQRTFYGDSRPTSRNSYRPPTTGPTNYSRYAANAPRREEPRNFNRRGRDSYNLDDIFLETRTEAEDLLEGLDVMLKKYDSVSVGQLYEMMNENSSSTDEMWGWRDLTRARVTRTRDGDYQLVLPRPEPLND